GTALPVSMRLPSTAPVTFDARLFGVSWHLEIRVVVGWGADVVLRLPLTVHAASRDPSPLQLAAAGVPPVGRDRRAVAWAGAAARAGLVNDIANERMRLELPELSLEISLERRGSDGLHYVGTLRWPSLGLDAHIAERRWVE